MPHPSNAIKVASTALLAGPAPAASPSSTFEDGTGMTNIVVSPGLWARYRAVARNNPGLLIRGILESSSGAINLVADRLTALDLGVVSTGRDFR